VLRLSRERSYVLNLVLNDDLNVEFIDDSFRLNELADKWRGLWSALPDATPFQSSDWLLSWWDPYWEGPLFSFAFWSKGELAA
jgi:CelD/BcsL family acetyltransferase involved in cellulose biosynthesis